MSNEYENRIDYWDNKIIVDKDGNVWVKQHIEPSGIGPSGWAEYDTRYGHCGLCGRLGCFGTCQGGV